jgi:hypothetical protein
MSEASGHDSGIRHACPGKSWTSASMHCFRSGSLPGSVIDPWRFGTDPDPPLGLTDPDQDHAFFVSDLQDGNKNIFSSLGSFVYNFLKIHLHNFSKIKGNKEETKQ